MNSALSEGLPDLSFVIPLLNEEESLRELYQRITAVMTDISLSYEVIFVDDGSTDGSGAVLRSLAENNPERVMVITLKRNYGKSNALMVGFDHARGARAVTMDADLQDRPEDLPKLLAHSDHDLVSAWRRSRKDTALKKFLSAVFNTLVSIFFGVEVRDINCGYKVYKRDLYKSLTLYGDLHRMTLVLAHMEGFSFKETPVEHAPRKYGSSKYPMFRARGLWDIISLGMMRSLQLRPFHFFAPWSVILFGVSGLLLLALIAGAAFGDGAPQLAHTLFVTTVLLGALLFLVGLILEVNLSIYMKDHPYRETIRSITGGAGKS